ncbi:helix-turn-helix transcriptional regulator [Herbiconiux ginsengi]|uniref:DNA-binding transcriptional regulator, CsgD family n=1 Tax=Herbiconiux ginsengi TaxID=381665 RepID=A0A1H3SY55_9MICO|nr:helix-turn-helix transcriptional regulator [Herbiconiux ginsengi]SDZ42912.1 DNA-binding transcriptional regulator, CsgD family [Herbiconiux ginsengi]
MSQRKNVPQIPGGHLLRGRDRLFNQARLALERSGPRPFVVVGGAPGVGRTAFVDALVAAIDAERTVHVVRGDPDLSAVSLGALAPVLSALPAGGESNAIVEFHRAVNRPEAVVVVDDAEHLDLTTLGVLEQVARAGVAAMVVARATKPAADGQNLPAARLIRHASIQIELPSLGRADACAMVKDRLGTSIGAAAADEMVRLASGSTRTLSELIEASVGICDLADDSGAWNERWPAVSEGLIASLPANPLVASPPVLDVVTLLAVVGELPVEQAGTSGVSERGAQRAEAAGFVVARVRDGRAWVELAHPLYRSVLLPTVSDYAQDGFRAAGIDMLDGYPEHRVRRALLQLKVGHALAPQPLIDLAHRELSERRYTTAITLGEHASRAAGADAALRAAGEYVAAQALSQIGRAREASEHFAAAWAAVNSEGEVADRTFIAALAQAEGNHLAFRELRPDVAVSRGESVLHRLDERDRALLESDLAKWRLMSGQGIPLGVEQLALLGPVETPGDLNLLIMTATLQTMGGNLTLAGEAVARGLAECDRFREVLPNARDLLELSEVLVLSFTSRFTEARTAARRNLARAERSNPSARGIWKVVLAIIELHGGSPARAWKLITEGRRDLVWCDIAGLLPTADALSAAVAARTGRFAIARSWLDQLAAAEIVDPKAEVYAALARAWVSAASGRPGFAIRSMGPALHKAVDGGHLYLAALVAYEAVRIEPVVGATVMLPHLLAARHAFPLAESHARAVIARYDVLPIAKELAEAGLLGPAIDAARWAADNSNGDLVRASLAHRLADSWTVRAGVAMSNRRSAQPRVTPLTDREWQLACGAAAHRTSAELASEFGISVRTVDNHLARIYRKLGITGRRELSAELSELRLDGSYEGYGVDAAASGNK